MSTIEPTKQYEGRGVNTYAQELIKQIGERDDTIAQLRAERDALARQAPLTWTNSPPTVPGWYWRRGGGGYAEVHKVTKHEIDHDSDLFHDYDWSDPIPEPQEPPSGTQK